MTRDVRAYPGTLYNLINSGLLQSGQRVLLREGTYTPPGDLVVPSPGITFMNYPGETAVIQPTGGLNVFRVGAGIYDTVLDGLILDGSVAECYGVKMMDGAYNLTIQNTEIKNITGQGILATGASTHDLTIENCSIHDCVPLETYGHGIYTSITGVTIRGCNIYANDGHGIHVFGGAVDDTTLIELNYVHDNVRFGIGIYAGHCTVQNNVSRRNGVFALNCDYDIVEAIVRFNTLLGKVGCEELFRDGATIGFTNNVMTNGFYGFESSNIGTAVVTLTNNLIKGTSSDYSDPTGLTLVDNISVDFTPIIDDDADGIVPDTGNPAIGAGVAIAGLTTDYGGNARSAPPTIGAWE